MKLLIDSLTKDLNPYIKALADEIGADNVVLHDTDIDPALVTTAILWNHRSGLFEKFKNIKLIASLGAGVDHILRDASIPANVYITRIISYHLTIPMTNFCVGAVIHFQRKFDQYLRDKETKTWHQEYNPERDIRVGILGLGVLGSDLAQKLHYLGFEVGGWSKSRKNLPGVRSFVESELDEFLRTYNLFVCLMPATAENKGFLNKSLFDKMPKGSFLINVARGHHQIDADIVAALDSGQLEGAFLDVFPQEPLPQESVLWTHPKVFITPHIAVVTKLEAAIPQIVENHKRVLSGQEPFNLVNRQKGY